MDSMKKDGELIVSDKIDLRVALTGATGFVGRCVSKDLKCAGAQVLEIGRSPSAPDAEFFQIESLDGNTDYGQSLIGCDVVIHLAARVHVMHDKAENPLAEFQVVNLHGTINLAKQAAQSGVKRFVYVSSIKVNGERTTDSVFTELDAPQPKDPYALSKWQAEQALRQIEQETGMEVVIVRPPLVYGPGVKANFYNLLRLVHRQLPLPLGSIQNRRSMVFVKNLADALVLCSMHPAAAGQTYLICDGQDLSTPQLIKEIAAAIGVSNRTFRFSPTILRHILCLLSMSSVFERLTQSLVVDSGKIRKELDWHPKYDVQAALSETGRWYLLSLKKEKTKLRIV